MNGESYSIQNIKYTTYITTSTPSQQGSFIGQSSTPYGWYIRLNGTDVYVLVVSFSSFVGKVMTKL